MNQPKYEDDYSTCAKTFSTFRIFADDINPTAITDALGVASTESFRKGEPQGKRHIRKANGWFYICASTGAGKYTKYFF